MSDQTQGVHSRDYLRVFLILVALALVTTGISFIDLGAFNTVAALLIAFAKTALVALIFMHVKYSKPLIALVIAASLLWLAILIGLTMADYLSRPWIPVDRPW